VAAAQALEARNQTQLFLAAATGGTTTPFTATMLLAPDAASLKALLGLPSEAAPLVGGKIPASYLPPQSLVQVVTVASQAAMLALVPVDGLHRHGHQDRRSQDVRPLIRPGGHGPRQLD
jgi:hypothetical protein